jgi:oligopeptide transport system substrate-binding protein
MKGKFLAVVVSVVMAATLLAGCSGTKADKVAKLISGGEPGSLHPALSQGTHESIILDHVFEGLMKRDKDSKIVPGMAKEYTLSKDNLTYTFTLRDGIKWSNGDPVIASDFEYAWKFALNPLSASNYAYQLYYLAGGEEYNSANPKKVSKEDMQKLEDAVGVKAKDDKTLVVTLKQATPYFLELCAFYTYYPIDQKVQQANKDWAIEGNTHVSNGPFKITQWNHDQDIVLAKNDNYYNKKDVKLSGIDFIISEDLNTNWQMYQNDEIQVDYDLPGDVLGKLKSENNAELKIPTELATYFYRFNTTKKPFNNVKVRKALSMAINRQSLIDNVSQGGQLPAYALVPTGVPDAKGEFRKNGGDYFAENIEEAKKLLMEGLKEEGMDKLSFSILYNTSEQHKKMAEAIQQMWSKLGIEVKLENVEFKVKIDREHALDFAVSRAGWIGDYVDPNTFLDLFTSWSKQNDTGWKSSKYDELIKSASSEFNVEKRMGYLHQAEKLIIEDYPIMPIYYYTRPMMVKSNLVGTTKAVNRQINLIYADFK